MGLSLGQPLGLSAMVLTPGQGGAASLPKTFRIAPVDANSFFVVRRQLDGSAMAYRFGRGSGAAADANNIGVAYPEFRLTGVFRLASYATAPTSPSVIFSDDVGAQDFVANAASLFMFSYHGVGASGALNAESIQLDGVPVSHTAAAEGDSFSLFNDVTAGNGTVTARRSLTVTFEETGAKFTIGTATGTGITFVYAGLSIGSGVFNESDLQFTPGGPWQSFEVSRPVVLDAARWYADDTYAVGVRDIDTGRRVSLRSNAPLVAGFVRGEVVKIASIQRTKGYLNFSAIANLAGFSWSMDFDVGPTGSQVVAANAITNGSFASGIAGWTSVIGTGVAWDAASGGVMRLTRDAGLVQRWRWNTGIPATANDRLLYVFDVIAFAGGGTPVLRTSPTNGLSATNALMNQATQLGRNGVIKKAAATNVSGGLIWAGYEYAAGTAGQVSDLDNVVVNNLGAV